MTSQCPKLGKMGQNKLKLLVTNELRTVIGFGEQIWVEFGAEMAENWVERRCWNLHGLPGTESEDRVHIT
jgi:hypothetical protein